MRIAVVLLAAAGLAVISHVPEQLAASTPAELYQEGLSKETAEGDLEAAISVYQRIVKEHPQETSVAARAQLHIGMCYEKLGRKQASAAYQEAIERFPTEMEVVEKARERLNSLEQSEQTRRPQIGAGPERTRAVLEELDRMRDQISSFSGSLAVSIDFMGNSVTAEGLVLFKRPGLLRVEMTGPAATSQSTNVFDGRINWTYQPLANLVAKVDVERLQSEFPDYENTNNILNPFQGIDESSIRYIRSDELDGEDVRIFEGESDDVAVGSPLGQYRPDWVEVWVATSDGLMRRTVGYRDTGVPMMTTDASISAVDPQIPDSMFVFAPPEGANTIDMTDTVLSMLPKSVAEEADARETGTTAEGSVEALIEELEEKRKALRSHRSQVSRQMQMMGTTVTHNTTESHKEPDKSRQELTSSMMPGGTITISDSGVMSTYMPAMKMAHRINMNRVKEVLRENGDGTRPETLHGMVKESIRHVGMEVLDGEEVHLFEGQSSDPPKGLAGVELGRIRVWVGVNDGLTRKKVTYNKQEEEVVTETRTNVEINIDIPDSVFVLSLPEGVQVMDMTESTIDRARQMQTGSQRANAEAGEE